VRINYPCVHNPIPENRDWHEDHLWDRSGLVKTQLTFIVRLDVLCTTCLHGNWEQLETSGTCFITAVLENRKTNLLYAHSVKRWNQGQLVQAPMRPHSQTTLADGRYGDDQKTLLQRAWGISFFQQLLTQTGQIVSHQQHWGFTPHLQNPGRCTVTQARRQNLP